MNATNLILYTNKKSLRINSNGKVVGYKPTTITLPTPSMCVIGETVIIKSTNSPYNSGTFVCDGKSWLQL